VSPRPAADAKIFVDRTTAERSCLREAPYHFRRHSGDVTGPRVPGQACNLRHLSSSHGSGEPPALANLVGFIGSGTSPAGLAVLSCCNDSCGCSFRISFTNQSLHAKRGIRGAPVVGTRRSSARILFCIHLPASVSDKVFSIFSYGGRKIDDIRDLLPDWETLIEAAARKGCSLATIYRRAATGALPVHRVHGRSLVRRCDVDSLDLPSSRHRVKA